MSTFSDFAFYVAHGGKLSEADYSASVDDAHAEILSQTNGKANTAPNTMTAAVKLCECALVDVIAGYKETAALLPKGVTSVTNDKFSVSTGGNSPARSEAKERATVCARYLQWPENLMCRWL